MAAGAAVVVMLAAVDAAADIDAVGAVDTVAADIAGDGAGGRA